MYSKKIQKNVQKNTQTKNSLDFSGLLLGPEKRRKLEKNSRGKKNSGKNHWVFSRKNQRNLLEKLQEKKFCKFFCIFLCFSGQQKKNQKNLQIFFQLSFDYYLTISHLTPFQNGSIEAKKGARQKFVHFWKALTILMLEKYLKS